ncbi:MAG: serine/threonine-protein kinase RsbW [Actinomycetota bacterium]|jgi:anti-sigma regulatory factor (Ser/Thr protein kinase)|nr:serine/threonine-protein kinase RsbW [Actinomycetota bacterium]
MSTRVNRGNGWSFADRDQHKTLVNDPANASDMRSFVADFFVKAEIPEHVVDEVLMAVGEVVANACRHGRRTTGPGQVAIRCEVHDHQLSVTVTDDGPGFDVERARQPQIPDVLSQGGRGFFLMRQLMDRVDVASSGRGTTVVLGRDLAR